MKTIKTLILFMLGCGLYLFSCQSKGVKTDAPVLDVQDLTKNQPEVHGQEIKEGEIVFSASLDQAMATKGNAIYSLKCQSCHRLTEERLVGPGWKGVTQKRNPTWILNMIINVDMMLESDPEAQKLLEQCLVRMPNQNITREEALDIIEFMRKNDGVK
ncbi:MAG: cytochrome c [Saprospiraceae bacterium]|nr:cytochrome c [Saprospiraceae bacterium]